MIVLYILIFSALFMIKGGWLGRIKWWKSFDDRLKEPAGSKIKDIRNKVASWFIDGSNLSALILLVVMAAIQPDFTVAVTFAVAWWIWIISSMGEKAGAVGDYKGGWGPYVDAEEFKRRDGVKDAFIFGIAGGALMSAASGFWAFIIAGASFPVVYFLGSSLYLLIHKSRSWAYAEPLYGIPFGIIYYLWLQGLVV